MAVMNRKKPWTTVKVDTDFAREMQELAKLRYFKGLAKKEPSLPEMTRLMRRTYNYQWVLSELKTKPRKEDMR